MIDKKEAGKPLKMRVDGRHEARKIALQALFEWSFHTTDLKAAAQRIKEDMLPPACDEELLQFLLSGVKRHKLELDKLIARCAPEWPVSQLPKLDVNILRIAILELYIEKSVPPKVAVDEAVELAKEFSTPTTASFINGALGTIIKLIGKDSDARTALFIGEFQPPHKGHFQAIKEVASRFEQIVIVIGGADSVKSFNTPLTTEERRTMIENVLDGMSFKPDERVEGEAPPQPEFTIVEVPDRDDHDQWLDQVLEKVGNFAVVYTNNPLVEQLFSNRDFPVFSTKKYKPDECDSRKIRQRIGLGQEWKKLVPQKVEKYLKERQIVQRFSGLMEAKR